MANTFDASIRHQIRLERAKSGEKKELRKLLKPLDDEIKNIINSLPSGYSKQQQDAAIKEIDKLIKNFYKYQLPDFFESIAKDTIDVESLYSAGIISISSNVDIDEVQKVSSSVILSGGFSKSIKGHKLSTWTSKLGREKLKRIKRALREGRYEELKKDEILKNVRKQFGISNMHAETITDLHINTFSNLTREEFDKANPNLVDVILWSSILDASTTEYCNKRADKLYDAATKEPVGHDVPWLEGPGLIHFGCRSTGVRFNRADLPRGRKPDKDLGGVPVSLIIRGK